MFFLVTKVGYKKAVFSLDAVATANLMCIMQANILPECERSTSTKTQTGYRRAVIAMHDCSCPMQHAETSALSI